MQQHGWLYRGVVGVALSVFILLAAACGGFGLWDTVECMPDWYGLTITPPPGATILEERCRSAFNPDFWLVFSMPASELEAFQAATPITDWTTDASELLNFADEAARATSLLAGSFGNGAISVEALVDMSDAELYTVYYKATFVD